MILQRIAGILWCDKIEDTNSQANKVAYLRLNEAKEIERTRFWRDL